LSQILEYDQFFYHWNTMEKLLRLLHTASGGFGRGLPESTSSFSSPIYLDLLRELANEGYFSVVDLDRAWDMPIGKDRERAEEARRMKKTGLVYVSSPMGYQDSNEPVIMEVASPLHRSWFSSHLQCKKTLPPTVTDLDTTWKQVLSYFSAAALRNPIRTPVTRRNASVVEAQYQQEFYRALYSLTGGACTVSPEYGGQASSETGGRIDFFIESKGWGIELLRDGDRIAGHEKRFRKGGAYHPWLTAGTMKKYVILDFRKTIPQKPSSMCFLTP
jgi:hypothetical protein